MSMKSNHLFRPGPTPSVILPDSPYCQLHRAAGYLESKVQTIGGFAGAQNFNLFQVTGSVELVGIWGEFTNVTEVTTLNAAQFQTDDGANQNQLTSAGGTALGGASLYSWIGKTALAATALDFHNASQVRYTESAFNRAFVGGIITQKNGANTYIRFRVTTDANTNCQITFYCAWSCRSSGGLVVPV